jgi:hypothetical protein
MSVLGTGLSAASHDEDALSVREAELSMKRRLCAPEESILITQGNLANTYQELGRLAEALRVKRDVYSGRLKLNGEEDDRTLTAAYNYAVSLNDANRFEEGMALYRKTIPVARRVLGESNDLTLRMRLMYAVALYEEPAATLDDLREAVEMLGDVERTARRVFGGAHPLNLAIVAGLRNARATLRTRETQSPA